LPTGERFLLIGKGHEESFWVAINVLHLDLDGGYPDVNICKDPSVHSFSLLYSITLCQSSMFYLSTFLLQIIWIISSFLKIMKKFDMGILIHVFLWT